MNKFNAKVFAAEASFFVGQFILIVLVTVSVV